MGTPEDKMRTSWCRRTHTDHQSAALVALLAFLFIIHASLQCFGEERSGVSLNLDPEKVFKAVGRPFAIIDCFCILDDEKIRSYLQLGCEVKGMGRGHIKRIKDSLQ